jgi:hypothetical protein
LRESPIYLKKIINITAEDSPNVKLALQQKERGENPTGEIILPGVMSWDEYCMLRQILDEQEQCIGLDAKFYVGPEVMLFPPFWLQAANQCWRELPSKPRLAKALGVDSAEGGDNTCYCAIDELGVVELISKKTRDTTVITSDVMALIVKHKLNPERVCFDPGGGGYGHACILRKAGYNVRTVAFGESLTMEPKYGIRLISERLENREERYVYVNRRAQMYCEASHLLDPTSSEFAIAPPSQSEAYQRLLFQLSKIPKLLDDKGRYWLPSKGNRTEQMKKRGIKTLIEIIGHSPDEVDALVLAVHGLTLDFAGFVAGGGN